MAKYMQGSKYDSKLPAVSSAAGAPTPHPAANSDVHPSSSSSMSHTHSANDSVPTDVDGPNIGADPISVQPSHSGASASQPQPPVRVVREHRAPVVPGAHDPCCLPQRHPGSVGLCHAAPVGRHCLLQLWLVTCWLSRHSHNTDVFQLQQECSGGQQHQAEVMHCEGP